MIERTYRVVRGHPGFEVEIRRLGALVQIAAGFPSESAESAANAWIKEDRRIEEIDDRHAPVAPPHIRRD